LLLARTSHRWALCQGVFITHRTKGLLALVVGVPDRMVSIDLPIGKQPSGGGEKKMPMKKRVSPARTRYRIVERAGNATACRQTLYWPHRISVARPYSRDYPIVGDRVWRQGKHF
jgi:23S rRNA pseudouridine955/2504/2580 synthase